MIQRVQTLYLLAATALMAIFSFSTLATFTAAEGIFNLSASGVYSFDGQVVYPMFYLMILSGLATLLPFFTIFFFKKRMLQLRMCVVEIVLSLGALVVAGVYYHLANRFFSAQAGELISASPRIVCILPIIAIIFNFMALKAILADEMLIKSLNRIR